MNDARDIIDDPTFGFGRAGKLGMEARDLAVGDIIINTPEPKPQRSPRGLPYTYVDMEKLERAVIEAAIKLAQTSDHIDDRDEWEDNQELLLNAARTLLREREKQPEVAYSREDIYFDHD